MKSLLTKIVASFAVIAALSGQPAVAETRSNIHFGFGGFSSSSKEVRKLYGPLSGGDLGVDIRLSNNIYSSTSFSMYGKQKNSNGIEHHLKFMQFEPTLKLIIEDRLGGRSYCGMGLSYSQVQEKAVQGKEKLEATSDAMGLVFKFGLEGDGKNNWGPFFELSFRQVKRDGLNFGGNSLVLGAKYYFDK